MSSLQEIETGLSPYPYPGLRPFHKSEADIFFGREKQIDQLLEKLDQHRFLAVLGPSGCGKSSLVRAGLIPALETGFMASAGYRWRTTMMRPGDSPLSNLAKALIEDGVCAAKPGASQGHDADSGTVGTHSEAATEDLAFLRATLNRGPLGLVEALRQFDFSADENLLLLVDQFEELFRFERHGGRSESRAFLDILLASAAQADLRLYVVITMRSEFLGQCPVFCGLPEAMNDSQFLTPRLNREQIHEAIVGPASMFNTTFAPEVVTRILNEMGTDPDQLPLMQHLLMRMWRRAALDLLADSEGGAEGDVAAGDDSRRTWDTLHGLEGLEFPPLCLTMQNYDEAGGLGQALSRHADKVFDQTLQNDQQRGLAEAAFRCLTEINREGHIIRRPTLLADVCTAAGIDSQDPLQLGTLVEVLNAFRAEGRSFLMPPSNEPLTLESRIDISHETLIRQWGRLKRWTEEEDRFRKILCTVENEAQRWILSGRRDDFLLSGVDLAEALQWRDRLGIASTRSGHPEIQTFVDESETRRDRRLREKQRAKYVPWLVALAAAAICLTALAIVAWYKSVEQGKRASAAVSRQTLDKALGLLAGGDATGSLLWIQDALRQDEALGLSRRERLHRIRLGAGMSRLARLENFWGLEEFEISDVAPSPDGSRVMAFGREWPDRVRGRVTIWRARARSDGAAGTARASDAGASQDAPWADLRFDLPVRHASWSPDGRYLLTATAADDRPKPGKLGGRVQLWDLQNPDKPKAVELHAGSRASLTAISPHRRAPYLLAVVETDQDDRQQILLWRMDAGGAATAAKPPIWTQNLDGTVSVVAFPPLASGDFEPASDTGSLLVVAGEAADASGWAHVYEAAGGQLRHSWAHPERVMYATFRPDAQRVATACQDGQVRVWDVDPPQPAQTVKPPRIFKGHQDAVLHVVFSPDGGQLVSSSRDNTARLWDADSAATQAVFQHLRWVHTAQFSPNGRFIVTASRDQTAKIWDAATGSLVVPALNHAGSVQPAHFTADSSSLVTRSWKLVRLWSLETANPPPVRLTSQWPVTASGRSENGQCLALIGSDPHRGPGQLVGIDMRRRTISTAALPNAIQRVWASEDGQRLLVAGQPVPDGPTTALVYRLVPDAPAPVALQLGPAQKQPIQVARFFDFGGKPILCTVSTLARAPEAGKAVEPAVHQAAINLRQLKETRCVLRTWNPQTGVLIQTFETNTWGEAQYFGLSPDGRQAVLATAYEGQPSNCGNAVLWHVAGDTKKGQGNPRLEHRYTVELPDGLAVHAAFDRTGQRLLTTGNANEDRVLLWDIGGNAAPATPASVMRHTSDVTFVGFSNDEDQRFIVSCSYDNTARLWENPRKIPPPRTLPGSGEGSDSDQDEVRPWTVLEHDKRVNHAVFHPDATLGIVATSSQDGSTRLWDVETGELVALFRDAGDIECSSFVDSPGAASGYPLLQSVCRQYGSQGYRVQRWRIDPLADQYEDCLPLLTARRLEKDVPTERKQIRPEAGRLAPNEDADKCTPEGLQKLAQRFRVYRQWLPSPNDPRM